jgi:MFS family permease
VSGAANAEPIYTDIPGRLDRLPWSRFHWLLIIALGVTWVLDGFEGTVVAAINPVLTQPSTLGLRDVQVGLAVTGYLAGCIAGALFFGHLTDRLGRKRLFSVTLLIYLAGAILTALSWSFASFFAFRLVTGMAIGGEYAAINSAIDELIPARLRGRVDLAVNGTFWVGAMLGAGATVILLDPHWLPAWFGWRVAFGLGGTVGFAMILVRQHVPESPRWLLTHGRGDEAEAITKEIESRVGNGRALEPVTQRLTVYPGARITFATIARTILVKYRSRALVGLALISAQAFFYNGMSFTYPRVLNRYFGVATDRTGVYVLCMAMANFLGPLLLGRLFDTVGRRTMIALTYALSAVAIVATELLFLGDCLNATTQTLCWAAAFFLASTAASAGYLTVSEIFPLEMRALAIALFYSVGTAIGGLGAPALFGALLESGRKDWLVGGYLLGAGLMLAAAATELALGVAAERRSLEDVAAPLSSEEPPEAMKDSSIPTRSVSEGASAVPKHRLTDRH